MKYAISTDGENVSAHFGRCPIFTILTIEDGEVVEREKIPNPGHQPGLIPRFLHEIGAECIVAGGMGPRATMLFDQVGISYVLGVQGPVKDVIRAIVDGTLKGGESACTHGGGKGYGLEKEECDHGGEHHHDGPCT